MGVPNGAVTLNWGDGEYTFNVAKIGQALELEEKCEAGVGRIFARLLSAKDVHSADWGIRDFRETIRVGLIGGGMEPAKATALVKRYVDERPWRESVEPAMVILMAAMMGVPGDDVGKKETAEPTKTEATTASSAPHSTASAPQSDSHHDKSMKSRSGNSPPASKVSTAPIIPTPSQNPQPPQNSTR